MTLGMKQIMVEVPDSVSDECAQYELDRAFSRDWISLHWNITDVQDAAGELSISDEDARDILHDLDYTRDANIGINRGAINDYVYKWRKEQEEES
jgi:hypothetical protein